MDGLIPIEGPDDVDKTRQVIFFWFAIDEKSEKAMLRFRRCEPQRMYIATVTGIKPMISLCSVRSLH
jgi:hypothetical protein